MGMLFRDGQIVLKHGSIVFTDDASMCDCCTSPSPSFGPSPSPGPFPDHCYDFGEFGPIGLGPDCLSAATGLNLTISDYIDCSRNAENGLCDGSPVGVCHCDSTATILNRSYGMTKDGWGYNSTLDTYCGSFSIELGTTNDPDDKGLLCETSGWCDNSPPWHPLQYCCVELDAQVYCVPDPQNEGAYGLGITAVDGLFWSLGSDGSARSGSECTISCFPGFAAVEVVSVAHSCAGSMHSRYLVTNCDGSTYYVHLRGNLT